MKRVLGAALAAGLVCLSSGASAVTLGNPVTTFSHLGDVSHSAELELSRTGGVSDRLQGWYYASPPSGPFDPDLIDIEGYWASVTLNLTGRRGDGSTQKLHYDVNAACYALRCFFGNANHFDVSLDGLTSILLSLVFAHGGPREYTWPPSYYIIGQSSIAFGAPPNQTPLPGALVLFVSALGIGGLAMKRRQTLSA